MRCSQSGLYTFSPPSVPDLLLHGRKNELRSHRIYRWRVLGPLPWNHLFGPSRNEAASDPLCPLIPETIHGTLFSVASVVGLLFTEGGREVESWKGRREGPEKSPKITVMQVDRQ